MKGYSSQEVLGAGALRRDRSENPEAMPLVVDTV